jgi:hypothetical protein
MIKSSHILIGAGAVAAIYFGGSYLLKLNRLSNELETETKVSIYTVSLSGIELAIKVKLKNPKWWKYPGEASFCEDDLCG